MSFDLYYSFHQWAMKTNNPLWKHHLRRLDAMYPVKQTYISFATEGY